MDLTQLRTETEILKINDVNHICIYTYAYTHICWHKMFGECSLKVSPKHSITSLYKSQGNVLLLLRNFLGMFPLGYHETTMKRSSYSSGNVPSMLYKSQRSIKVIQYSGNDFPETAKELYRGTFGIVWGTFHINIVGTFYGLGVTFWKRSKNIEILAVYINVHLGNRNFHVPLNIPLFAALLYEIFSLLFESVFVFGL